MTQPVAPVKFGIGARALRKEDASLITGHGQFTGDYTPPGTLHAVVLRSVMAHARFTLANLDEARTAEGVHLILTEPDIADLGLLPCRALMKQPDGSLPAVPPRPLLNTDTVRYVGDPIAFVVADSVNAAKSAAEAIFVEYEPLDVVAETGRALDPAAPLVWPDRGSNLAFTYASGDADATAAAFAGAARVVSLDVVNNRLVPNYMEGRACVAEWHADTERYTLTLGTQGGHGLRDIIAKSILRIDPKAIRVITPDVGGGFGPKTFVYHEYPLAMVAAKALGRPVKWVQERTEHFLSCAHGRDNLSRVDLAFDANHRIVGMKVDVVANIGAYFNQYAPFIPWVGVTMSTGLYDIPALAVNVRGVLTHTAPTDAYRGAGRPEAAYLIERAIDFAAAELGVDRVELRKINFIAPAQLPYRTPTGRLYDTGEFAGHLDRAVEASGWNDFPARRAASAANGKLRGIGLASYIEACAFPGAEEANLSLNDDGSITLFIGTQTNGQGHATAYAQVIAGHLGLDMERIHVVQGDTDQVANGGGTGGSRSIPLGAASVDLASKVLVEKIKAIAADKFETAIADLELDAGRVRIAGTDREMTLSEIAAAAPDAEARKAKAAFKQAEATYPNGTQVCELEVDPLTGAVEILAYTSIDDFGVTLNPILLAGQIHGGIAQGIGQALTENTVYDADGQLLTASFMDYGMPRADQIPSFHFETRNVPSTTNMLGIKGAGEAGTIGACPAVMNALVDALAVRGIRHIDMPATPEKVWARLNR
ncbi:MAG: xanthine dehydrogenase family protein molybdopterin-binding subunit [Hyphomicrobiaceae bacterium]|nr:xanthine dehydrogenase family protein molybdopterin-binding subunit [Hyphomicrobiaceae bacterium]